MPSLLLLTSLAGASARTTSFAGYSLFAGFDVTAPNDTAFDGLCQTKGFYAQPAWIQPVRRVLNNELTPNSSSFLCCWERPLLLLMSF